MSDGPTIAELKERARAGDAGALQALRGRGFFAGKSGDTQSWPVSAAQRRLWVIDRMMPGLPVYNIATALQLDGALDVDSLRRAVHALIERHEALRTTFTEVDGEPRQLIGAVDPAVWRELDLSGATDPLAEARVRAADEAAQPFDLGRGPLFRCTLVRLATERHLLLCTLHHIVSDAWSAEIMQRELAALYGAFAGGAANPLPPLPRQYRDFARWQNEQLAGPAGERARAAWLRQLGGERTTLALPTDFVRPAVQNAAGRTFRFALGRDTSRALAELGRAHGATTFMTLVALLKLLLARYTGQEDISVGSPVAGRERVEWEGMIGFFVNTLVLRDRVARDDTFVTLLARVRETCLHAYEHQAYPFDRLVDDLKLERDFSRSPLFDVSVQLLTGGARGGTVAGLRLTEFDHGFSPAKCDLSFDFTDTGVELVCSLTYHAELFAEARIRRLADHLRQLAIAIVADPSCRLGEYELLAPEERRRLLVAFNPTPVAAPMDTLPAAFERVAARQPAAAALRHGGTVLSYAELDAGANRIAQRLRARGVAREAIVAVMLERGCAWTEALLGVMKAGAIYLPIDPALPPGRVTTMLRDSGAVLVITSPDLQVRLPDGLEVLLVERADESTMVDGARASANAPAPADGAYLIYTSGSTGEPKGVLVEHRGLVNTIRDQIAQLGLSAADRVLQFASTSFDASLFEVWNAWLSGATLVIAPEAARSDAAAFRALLREAAVTMAVLPPSFLRSLDRAELSLRILFTAGEAADPEDARHYAARLTYVNGYGPTEASICSTIHVVQPGDAMPFGVPIGRPIGGTRAYVLDAAGQLAPIGVIGELWVAGAGVARGYWRRPELTAERFAPDPFFPGGRMYRTGDRCRWREDGALEFFGRTDAQIKLRGFRIELGEIEAALRGCAGVREAAVTLRIDGGTAPRLVGYVVPVEGSGFDEPAVREQLRQRLPDYMVPAAFVTLAAMPLSTAGKIDRRALPPPTAVHADYVAPRDDVERVVTSVLSEVLRAERLGVHDGFFQHGGNSLLAIQAISRLRDTFRRELPITDFFAQPTPEGVAAALRRDLAQREHVEKVARLILRLAAMSPEEKQQLLAQRRGAGAGGGAA
ncbi:non-ribosomal peptide synthetase [Opitutus terrae]|uniref:Amino acid adenylation domain protein n=1 Tax=Opitutus terrae (strain DSM 11246 / JCM 15787 / PB90-1) TaxID=452637 RepID=B1ZYL8_OPITP|nr:non-ribosomal peptide synthetase [Opitutus terrae]ACB75254.1 amino acid adenylation domain protein [Opitutus terrae PB90-1]